MTETATYLVPRDLAPLLGWRRVRVVVGVCVIFSLMILPTWEGTYAVLLGRLIFAGLVVLLAFGLFERRPKRLPRWLARWFLQVLGVAIAVPFGVSWAYWLTTMGDPQPWYEDELRLTGFAMMTGFGVLVAPWIAIAALMRQIKGEAEKQALTFDLERSEYEREALDARLRLLQAQVEPHFLFNTLANIRELVESGAPQASEVLSNLIAYLRAAVPRLHDPVTTIQQELELVRAYLEVMHMRMPDRLQFMLHADDAAQTLDCPSTTLLTLVENALRHGIDPSEVGGRIEVRVQVRNGRCLAQVIDTGVGLHQGIGEPGTGLSNLRERLMLAFDGDAQLQLLALEPHGVCAEVEFPARRSSA